MSRATLKRHFITLFYLTILLYFIVMDFRLYFRIRDYAVRPLGKENEELEYKSNWIPCEFDPLCTVTVKGMLLDFPNFFLLGPLACIFDHLVGISRSLWISPNAISFTHVIVALVAGKCVSSKHIGERRIGVLLFQIRSWMDDLDGIVARKRMNVQGERSEIGTFGYFVDGICDAIGTVALFVGIYYHLRWNLPKHGYEKLQTVSLPVGSGDVGKSGSCVVHRKKVLNKIRGYNSLWLTVILLIGSIVASSIAWNRYVYLYQELLESDYEFKGSMAPRVMIELHKRQNEIFRSQSFSFITTLWRLLNPHAITDYLLFAVFIDRLCEYVDNVKWAIYGIILLVVYFTEFHYHQTFLINVGSSADNLMSLEHENFTVLLATGAVNHL